MKSIIAKLMGHKKTDPLLVHYINVNPYKFPIQYLRKTSSLNVAKCTINITNGYKRCLIRTVLPLDRSKIKKIKKIADDFSKI